MKKSIICVVLCVSVLLAVFFPQLGGSASAAYSASSLEKYIDGIISFKLKESGAASVQQLIDGALSDNAGTTAEWYILALRQYEKGYNFSSYASALQKYVDGNASSNAATRQKYALLLIAAGSDSSYIDKTINDSIAELGIMSYVYGLHLLNNGKKSSVYTSAEVIERLLSFRLSDGGWALSGEVSDIDVTSMVIQALAPHYKKSSNVKQVVDSALTMLSSRQLPSGDYKGFGTENPESTAQVITAISALGIDCFSDGRFIKNGNTLLDGLLKYRLSNGSFCHVSGGSYVHSSTAQALYSLVAAWRQSKSLGSLYIFSASSPIAATRDTKDSTLKTDANSSSSPSKKANLKTTSATDKEVSASPNEKATAKASLKPTEKLKGDATAEIISDEQSTLAAGENAFDESMTTSPEGANSERFGEVTDEYGSKVSVTTKDELRERKLSAFASYGYKKWAVLAVWILVAALCLVLFLAGKRKGANFVAVILIGVALTVVVLFTNIQRKDSYYTSAAADTGSSGISVTMSIRCDTIKDKHAESSYVPADGTILDSTVFSVADGTTAYDVLVSAAKQYNIQVENDTQTADASRTAYISGIAYIYEFDFGDLSGWVFRVNGETPSAGCGEYVLSDGDSVEWLYTCELGDDLP